MQSQVQGDLAPHREGNEVARDIMAVERVMSLEIPEAALAPDPIHEPGNALLRADFYGLGDEGICGRFVAARGFRDYLHETRKTLAVHEFDEADELVSVIGSDEIASFNERGMALSQCFEVLAIVLERYALSIGGLVVNALDPFDEVVIELRDSNPNSRFLGSADHVPRLVIDLGFPPVLEGRNGHHSKPVVSPHVSVFRFDVGNALQEGEDIGLKSFLFQMLDEINGSIQRFEVLYFEVSDPDDAAVNPDLDVLVKHVLYLNRPW